MYKKFTVSILLSHLIRISLDCHLLTWCSLCKRHYRNCSLHSFFCCGMLVIARQHRQSLVMLRLYTVNSVQHIILRLTVFVLLNKQVWDRYQYTLQEFYLFWTPSLWRLHKVVGVQCPSFFNSYWYQMLVSLLYTYVISIFNNVSWITVSDKMQSFVVGQIVQWHSVITAGRERCHHRFCCCLSLKILFVAIQ